MHFSSNLQRPLTSCICTVTSRLRPRSLFVQHRPYTRSFTHAARAAQIDTITAEPRTTSMFEQKPAVTAAVQPAEENVQPPASSPPPAPSTPATVKPGDMDALRFSLDPSVRYWLNFYADTLDTPRSELGAAQVQQLLTQAQILADAQSAAYWAYHLSRTAFFAGNGFLSLLAEQLTAQVQASNTPANNEVRTSNTLLPKMLDRLESEMSFRMVEVIGMYKQDLAHIKDGAYKLPWDMTTLTHRQYNPLFALRRSVEFVGEAVQTLSRRARRSPDPVWMESSMYPDYYLSTFHYQSDGWLSNRSASVYETSTEVLFFGRQDAMQRSALVPIHRYMQGRTERETTLLEVAAGTGRFHTFIKDNYPDMSTIVSDLSPFYLSKAQSNVAYWKQQRAADQDLGGVKGTGSRFLQCAAESLAVADESVDIVVCVYLYHELPREAQEAATKEMFRVLKPGGLAVLTDSVQLGDRGAAWDNSIANFGNFNEPFYKDFVAVDLGDMFERAGFMCGTKWTASASKTLSFMKPAA